MKNILISSKPIEISEHKNYKLATFMISVLDEYDLNGRMIPKEVGEKYHQTIIGFPIVAKLITDLSGNPTDFRGHEMHIVQDKHGNKEAKFGTMPIGSILSSWIEERVVEGYEGIKSCIMIQAKLWSDRFPEYFTVFDKLWLENNIDSSWELSVDDFEKTPRGKILKVFSFVGNCLLGRTVSGAVPKAGVLEYAEKNIVESFEVEELELAQALSLDTIQNSNIATQLITKEDETKLTKQKEIVLSEEAVVEIITENEELQETSASAEVIESVTNETVVEEVKNSEEIVVKEFMEVSELEQLKTQLSEVNATISNLNSEIETKNTALTEASITIQALNVTIAELTPFKEKFDKDEQDRVEAETIAKKEALKTIVSETGLFTEDEIDTSEEISGLIESLNEKELNQIIATRLIASLHKMEVKTETASVKKEEVATASLVNDETEIEPKSIMKSYLGGRK